MARVCSQCGAGTEPGVDFCGQCEAYLDWDERAPEAPAPAAVSPEPEVPDHEPEQPALGLADRLKAAVGIGQAPDDDEPPPRERDVVAPVAEVPPPAIAAAAAPIPAPAEGVRAVKPGAAAPRPRAHRPPPLAEPIAPGDLICGECGTGNKPVRNFCRRCGNGLIDAEVARVPWWRRLLTRRPRRGLAAGARPTVRPPSRLPRNLVGLVVVLGLVGLTVQLVRPHATEWRGAVLDRVKGVQEVNPQRVTAASRRSGHSESLASDTRSNTWWSPKGTGTGSSAVLGFAFVPPIRLVYISIQPGNTVKDKKTLRQIGRPHVVKLTMTTQDPATKRVSTVIRTLTLQNQAGDQTMMVATSDVVAARLEIVSIYPGVDPKTGVAVAEVEFRARK